MARGNQRDKSREAKLKKQASAKTKNTMSGTEFQRAKELAAEKMREKQRKSDQEKADAAAGKK